MELIAFWSTSLNFATNQTIFDLNIIGFKTLDKDTWLLNIKYYIDTLIIHTIRKKNDGLNDIKTNSKYDTSEFACMSR